VTGDDGSLVPYAPHGPRLYYERHGSGEPLLFITGFVISSAVFEPILPMYAEHFDVITYDNRWSARSPKPLRLTSVPELASDAAGLLDALGVESAHVYGLSMGAMVAQELALRFPERVRGLILGGGTPGGPRAVLPYLGELASILAHAATNMPREPFPWISGFLFSDEFRRDHPERVRELTRPFVRHFSPPWGINAHWWATVFHDTVSRLDQIQAPTLVMHGEEDGMAPVGVGELLAARIPDAELAIVPGAGHAYPLELPEESLRIFLEWYDARSPIRAGEPRRGVATWAEPVTRALGLQIGAMRTGHSLARMGLDVLSRANGRRELRAGGRERPPPTLR
jgi:3-oxoadipate enol-lactonase